MSNDRGSPPLLFDVAVPGEQVRSNDGPWLGPPPEARGSVAEPPPLPVEPGASTAPEAPASLERAELERTITRELARHIRSELERRLPEVLEEAQGQIRKAVDDALIDAVSASRRRNDKTAPPHTAERTGAHEDAESDRNPTNR